MREQAWGWAGVGGGPWPWACSHSYPGPEGLEWVRLGTSWGQVLGWEDQARRGQGGRHPQNPCTHAEALAGAMGWGGAVDRSTENFKAPGFSGAAGPPPQTDKTVIVINIFNLNDMMCGRGREKDRQRKRHTGDKGARDRPDTRGSESEGWRRRGRRQTETEEKGRQPEA